MTYEQLILRERPYCQLPMCCNESSVVLDPHKPEMLAVCREHADLGERYDERARNESAYEFAETPESKPVDTSRCVGLGDHETGSANLDYAQYLDDLRDREAYEWDKLQAEEHAQRLLQEETDQ